MSPKAEILDEKKYRTLLGKTLPRVIHTEEENQRYIAELEALDGAERSPEEERMAELLTVLIEEFEGRRYTLPAAAPLDVVHHLMEANDLRPVDMLDVFGTRSIASEVLNGKRDLAKSHIEKLSRRFNVSPEVFFETRVSV